MGGDMSNVTSLAAKEKKYIGQFPSGFGYYACVYNHGPGGVQLLGGTKPFTIPSGQAGVYVADRGNLEIQADEKGAVYEVLNGGALSVPHP
jgi:hypothetical protein